MTARALITGATGFLGRHLLRALWAEGIHPGVLVRQRGKPMQIAQQKKQQHSEQARLQHLQPQLEQLVLAARQLEITDTQLVDSLRQLLTEQ